MLALRGATTCDEDTKAEIEVKTQRLVREMLERNAITHDDIVSILFTATDDLTAEFPATAARALGLGDVPLICARELGIAHGKPALYPCAHAFRRHAGAILAAPCVPGRCSNAARRLAGVVA